MMKYCLINGQQQNTLSITDRGLAYGDGLFTTAKIVDGKVAMLEQHLERLTTGCKQLGICIGSFDELSKQLEQAALNFTLAVLKVVITAGSGGRGYSRDGLDKSSTNIIIMVFDFPTHYLDQVNVGISLGISNQQMAISPMLSGLKHLNRLEQVLLRAELDEQEEDDLLVTNASGNVIETTSANFFYWIGEQLYTPEIDVSGVNGLMRQSIMTQLTNVTVKQTSLSDLEQADAMFICNSVMGVMPVKQYNGRRMSIQAATSLRKLISD